MSGSRHPGKGCDELIEISRAARVPVLAITCGGLFALAIALRFIWGSELAYLGVSWLPDDAYYYLQTAWQGRTAPGFTFDGQTTTYGFQPLWMLLVTTLASLTGDKELLLRLTLTTAAFLHVAVGCLLWAWLRRGGQEWRGLAAAALWWFNPPLFHLDVSGMEAPLYALLLVLLLGFVHPGARGPCSGRSLLLYGALCGLMVLCRTEACVLVAGLVALRVFRSSAPARQRAAQAGLILAGLLLVAAPWGVYAAFKLGSVAPTSGQVKFTGAPARMARSIADILPFTARPLRAALPAAERPIFDAPDLQTPTPGFVAEVGVLGAVSWAIGFWLPSNLVRGEHSLRDWFLLPLLAVFLALIARGLVRRGDRDPIPWAPGAGLVAAWALANLLLNGLVLMPYAKQQFWHRVPESLFLIIVVAHGLPYLRAALAGLPRLARGFAAYAAVVGIISAWVFAGILTPRSLDHEQATNRAAWDVVNWMNGHLPAGTRVGSWHSGLFGYFADGPVVVNLDGLANSPAFVAQVVPGELAYRLGQSPDNPTLDYLRAEGIHWLVDTEHPSHLGSQPFQQVVPPGSYDVAYVGEEPVSWDLDTPTHVLAVVRME